MAATPAPWTIALPRRCAVCSGWGRDPLCRPCRARFAAPADRCPRCALRTPGAQVCGACLRQPPPYQRTVAAVDYAFPWAGLVQALKFGQQVELAAALGPLVLAALEAARPHHLPDSGHAAQTLLPVPLSRQRLAERGYNQSWALCRQLARRLGLPASPDALLRLRDTPHQVGLSRQARAGNLRDAFWVPPAALPGVQGRHLALVDDVMTTGETAAAASTALLSAGAASVQLWVVARTPAPTSDMDD